MSLRPLDAARKGQLLLQRGRSGTRQIVSEAWIDEQTRTHITLGNHIILPNAGYGYQTWTDAGSTRSIVLWGYGGQFVWLVPQHRLSRS
jgi:CubicO group peptidase (beta-lactamase class C family)